MIIPHNNRLILVGISHHNHERHAAFPAKTIPFETFEVSTFGFGYNIAPWTMDPPNPQPGRGFKLQQWMK